MHSSVSPKVLDIIKSSKLFINNMKALGVYADFEKDIEAVIVTNCLFVVWESILAKSKKSNFLDDISGFVFNTFPHCEENDLFSKKELKKIKLIKNGKKASYLLKNIYIVLDLQNLLI